MRLVTRIVEALWPPLALWRVNRVLMQQFEEYYEDNYAGYERLVQERKRQIDNQDPDSDVLVCGIDEVFDTEARRMNILESKASWLLAAAGLSVTLLTVIPAFTSGSWALPCGVARIAGVLLAFAAGFHLVSAAYYAVKVFKVGAIFIPTTYWVEQVIRAPRDARHIWAANKFAAIEVNCKVMSMKSNSLSVAQDLFLRGLMLLTALSAYLVGLSIL